MAGGALLGAIAFMLLRYLLPEVRPSAYANVVGIAAALGAGLGVFLARKSGKPPTDYRD